MVNAAALAGAVLLGAAAGPAAAQDAGSSLKPADFAKRQAERTIKRLHGTAAHTLSTRGGKAPVPGEDSYGAYAAILYAPGVPERTEERKIEAVVVLPSRAIARLEDILPPDGEIELAATLAAALQEKLEGADENLIAAAARAAANGLPAEEGIPDPAVWTSRKGRAPTLHVAWPACALAPCEEGVTEVTVPATWIEPRR